MTDEVKKAGGQPGNQNARKHGFYSDVLDEKQQKEFEVAIEQEGLDEEIAMLRIKIKSIFVDYPSNVKLQTQSVESLARIIRIKMNISKNDKPSLAEAVGNVLKDVGLPVATIIANIIKKG